MKWRAKLEKIHKIFQGEVSCTLVHARTRKLQRALTHPATKLKLFLVLQVDHCVSFVITYQKNLWPHVKTGFLYTR
jgi:hypothetical protein